MGTDQRKSIGAASTTALARKSSTRKASIASTASAPKPTPKTDSKSKPSPPKHAQDQRSRPLTLTASMQRLASSASKIESARSGLNIGQSLPLISVTPQTPTTPDKTSFDRAISNAISLRRASAFDNYGRLSVDIPTQRRPSVQEMPFPFDPTQRRPSVQEVKFMHESKESLVIQSEQISPKLSPKLSPKSPKEDRAESDEWKVKKGRILAKLKSVSKFHCGIAVSCIFCVYFFNALSKALLLSLCK